MPPISSLTRLALRCSNLNVLQATAFDAIMGYENAFEYRESAATAAATLDILTARDRLAGPDLLRAAAEAFDRVGDPDGLRRVYALAHDAVQDDALLPREARIDRAQFRIRFGSYLNRQGEPDRALQELQASLAVFATLGDDRSRAVTLGDIARIRANKGEVDEALKLHSEAMQTYDALGDRRSRAVALGDIARIRADKGEVDEALKLACTSDCRPTTPSATAARAPSPSATSPASAPTKARSTKLSSCITKRCRPTTPSATAAARAVTLGDIARIRANKGEVDEALKLHLEQVQIFDALGDRRSRAVTLGDIARIRANKGEVDEALKLHYEQIADLRRPRRPGRHCECQFQYRADSAATRGLAQRRSSLRRSLCRTGEELCNFAEDRPT